MINEKILRPAIDKATKELVENLKVLYDHLIQVQKNQLEFEKYLKDIKDQNKIIIAMLKDGNK